MNFQPKLPILHYQVISHMNVSSHEGVFFFAQTQTQTWGCVGSESHAVAWYAFHVAHHINMLI